MTFNIFHNFNIFIKLPIDLEATSEFTIVPVVCMAKNLRNSSETMYIKHCSNEMDQDELRKKDT